MTILQSFDQKVNKMLSLPQLPIEPDAVIDFKNLCKIIKDKVVFLFRFFISNKSTKNKEFHLQQHVHV
jgi:hypothetical protein